MFTHHATLLYAPSLKESAIPEDYLQQSTDVLHVVREKFSIDDARELTAMSSQTPFEAELRIFVIVAQSIAVEAQNALLKLLEEPPRQARFYIVLPQTVSLLPTLLSRLSIDSLETKEALADEHFTDFKNAVLGERLACIANKTKTKDQQWIEAILQGTERECASAPQENVALMKAVVHARTYIATRGASPKMLLEEIALSL